MNNINKNIFENYETVETALLNELATEVKTKGKKARVLKGEGYYVKYDGVCYDITAEQCRIYKLIRNNYNMFVEQLNSAKSDMLGFWRNVWGERLPNIIADLEKGIEICQKYFDAFKAFVTEPEETVEETVEENDEENDEVASEVASEEVESETITEEYVTPKSDDVDVDRLIRELRLNGLISNEDKIVVNEDEYEITADIYKNGRWSSNVVLYEYD